MLMALQGKQDIRVWVSFKRIPLKELFFRAFPNDKKLCIVHCLRQLLKSSDSLEAEENPLFISYTYMSNWGG